MAHTGKFVVFKITKMETPKFPFIYRFGDGKYYGPVYNNNHSIQYGSNLFVGYIWPIDKLLFNQVIAKNFDYGPAHKTMYK